MKRDPTPLKVYAAMVYLAIAFGVLALWLLSCSSVKKIEPSVKKAEPLTVKCHCPIMVCAVWHMDENGNTLPQCETVLHTDNCKYKK